MNPQTPIAQPAPVLPVAPAVDPNAAAATPAAPAVPDLSSFVSSSGGVAPIGATPPSYAPDTVNQTVDFGGVTWKGQPGGSWTPQSLSGGGALPGGTPKFDLVGATNAAYNTPAIAAANKAISDRQQASANAQAEINDNPFYSEASRTGQLAKEQTSANADITVQQNTLAQLNSNAAIAVAAAQGQYNINDTAYQQSLTNFQNMLSSGALDGANPQDLQQLSVQTGIPLSMIQSMQSVSNKKDNPQAAPQLIQSKDSNGNLVLLAVDSNGNVINQTTVPNTAGKPTGGSTTVTTTDALKTITPAIIATLNSTGQISPSDYQKAKAAWLEQGLPAATFDSNFGTYADTNRADFQSAYGFKNPAPVWSTTNPGQKIGSLDANGNVIKN